VSYIELAKEEGGPFCAGRAGEYSGPLPGRLLVEPTVIVDSIVGCRVNQEEIFGPVVTVIPFRNEAEVLSYANGTNYGLCRRCGRATWIGAHRVAERLETGTVWVNCWLLREPATPFGGVKKQEWRRREGGDEPCVLHGAQNGLALSTLRRAVRLLENGFHDLLAKGKSKTMKEKFLSTNDVAIWDRLIQFEGDLSSTAARLSSKYAFFPARLGSHARSLDQGRTAVGRVTALLLQFNRRDRVVNRRNLIAAGYYPR